LLCAAAQVAGAEDIYRWVDAEGRVHYGDKPPPESAERIDVSPAPAADPGLGERRERGERLSDVLTEERKAREEERESTRQAAEARRAKCAAARSRYERAANASVVYEESSDPQNPRILDDSERGAYEQRLQEEIRRYCNPDR
jgi:hypothetical protein